jgi:glycerol uptake facilitator protein
VSIFGAEVIGTAILILLGNGVVAAVLLNHSKAQNGGWIVITLGWGMAVAMGAFAVGQFSGAHLNPAVTLGFAAIGNTEWGDVPEYLAGEFVGAFLGATLVYAAYSNHWGETEDPGLKLACFSTAPAIRNTVSNFITEFIGTFILLFGILAIVANEPLGAGGLVPLWSASSSSASGSRSVARRATRSTRPATWGRA